MMEPQEQMSDKGNASASETSYTKESTKESSKVKGRKRAILKRSSNFFLKFVVIILSLATFLLATPVGTKIIISAVNSLDMLEIEHDSGTVLDKLTVSKFHLTLDDLDLTFTDTQIGLHLRCLWRYQLCVDEISGDKFLLNVTSDDSEELRAETTEAEPEQAAIQQSSPENASSLSPANDTDELINIPYFYKIAKLTFNKAKVKVNDVEITTEKLMASGEVGGADITLNEVSASSLVILTDTSDDSGSETKSPDENQSWPQADLPEISLPLNLRVDNLKVASFSLDDIATEYLPQQVDTQFKWLANHLEIDRFIADLSPITKNEIASVNLSADYHFLSPYQGEIKGKVKLENTSNSVSSNDETAPFSSLTNNATYQIALTGPLDKLGVAIERNDAELSAGVSAVIDVLSRQLPFELTAAISDFGVFERAFNKQLKQQLPETSEVNLQSGKFAVGGDIYQQNVAASINLADSQYKDVKISLTANHKLTSSSASNQHMLVIDTLSFSDEHTQSKFDISGSADIALSKSETAKVKFEDSSVINWQGTLTSNNFQLPNATPLVSGIVEGDVIANGSINYDVDQSDDSVDTRFTWQFDGQQIDLSGKLNQVPFIVQGYLSINDQLTINGTDLFVDALGTQVHLNGYAQEQWFIDGSIVSEDLALLHPQLSGKTSSSFSINGELSQPKISLTTRAIDLAYQATIHDEFHFDDFAVDLVYQPLQQHLHQVNFESKKFRHNHMAFKDLFASLEGDIEKQALNANWQGETAGNLMLSSQYNESANKLDLWLDQAELQYLGYFLMPTSRVSLSYDFAEHELHLAEHCWVGDGSSLCFDEQNTLGTDGELNALLAVDASSFNQSLYPDSLLIDTKLSGSFSTWWQQGKAPSFDINLKVSEGNIKHTLHDDNIEVVTWQHGVIQVQIDKDKLLQRFTLTQSSQEPLINVVSYVDLTKRELPLTGKVEVNKLSLSPLKAFAPDIDDLTAELASKLTLSGTLREPYVKGDISLDAQSLTFNRSKNHIKRLTINTLLDGSSAILDGSLHVDQDPVFINANMNWQQVFHATGRVKTEQVSLSFPPNVDVTIAPDLNFDYQKDTLRLGGKIDVLEGLLELEQLPEDTVNVSEDTIIVDDNGEAIVKESRLGIYSDIEVIFNDKFALSGYGFNGNLSGQLQLEQVAYQPMQLHGLLNVNDGVYQAYGQHLNVTSGKVTFNGSPKNPFVDFRAERYIKSDDVHAGITITGLANALELNLFSTPMKPQPEILSYLIRGRGIDEGTGNTAALGIALGTSLTKASRISDALKKLPIFHNVALDTEIDGDQTQATISGYIGDRLYLKYGIGIEEPVDEVTVRFYILNQLWLETVSSIEKSIDVYYSFEVD